MRELSSIRQARLEDRVMRKIVAKNFCGWGLGVAKVIFNAVF